MKAKYKYYKFKLNDLAVGLAKNALNFLLF